MFWKIDLDRMENFDAWSHFRPADTQVFWWLWLFYCLFFCFKRGSYALFFDLLKIIISVLYAHTLKGCFSIIFASRFFIDCSKFSCAERRDNISSYCSTLAGFWTDERMLFMVFLMLQWRGSFMVHCRALCVIGSILMYAMVEKLLNTPV